MQIPELIRDLALMLLAAGAMTLLFKKLRQPLVLGYIVAGFLTGPYFGFFPGVLDSHSVHTWSEIGVIVLMFCLGLEFNLHKLASVGGTAIITAITEMTGLLILGYGCGMLLGWSTMNSILLGGLLSMSSTTIIIKAFDDLKLKGKKFTELVFGACVVEDIAGIFMMVILSTIAVSQAISGPELGGRLVIMLFYLVVWLLLGIYLIPSFLNKTKSLMNDETLLIVSLGICFGMVLLAYYLGFSTALGAFLAGSLLAGTLEAERIEHISKPIKDLFGAVFFISVGMLVNPALVVEHAIPILVITLVTIIGKNLFSALGVVLAGQPLNTAVLCGFSLAQIGEFSFIIASLGISLGLLSDFIYPIVVSVSVITTFSTPYGIGVANNVYGFISRRLPQKAYTYLSRHTSEDQPEKEQDSDWVAYIKKYFSRLTLYSIVILGIIFSGTTLLWPFLSGHLPGRAADFLSLFIILVFAAPFVGANLFQRNQYFIPVWFKSKTNRLPLLALNIFRMALMVVMVMLPIRIIFNLSDIFVLLAAMFIVAVSARSDLVVGQYIRMESRFLANLNERQLETRKTEEPDHRWLDEQLYVGKIVCDAQFPFLGIPLGRFNALAQARIGLSIIKIIRGQKHINIPGDKEVLKLGDVVFMAGSVSELDNYQLVAKMELSKKEDGSYQTLREFIQQQDEYKEADQLICFAVTVESGSKLVGRRIKDSAVHNDWGSMLLGLERNLYPILQPNLNMKLRADDLIWVLGPQKMAGRMAKADVL